MSINPILPIITSLTPQQEAKIPEYVEKYSQIGVSTLDEQLECDPKKVEPIIHQVYACANQPAPPKIHYVDSPIGLQELANQLEKTERQWYSTVYGAMEASWISFYIYMRDELGASISLPAITGLELALQLGWFIPFDEACLVAKRPLFIHRNSEGKLDHDTGPVIKWADDEEMYAVNGVVVDKRVITDIESYTPQEVLLETNVELRRIMLDRYDPVVLFERGGAITLDEGMDHQNRKMVLKKLPFPDTEEENIHMLFVKDPAKIVPGLEDKFPETGLRVNPILTSVHDALSSTFNLTKDEYKPIVEI